MKKSEYKVLFFVIFCFFCAISLAAFDWPQKEAVQSDKLYSYFAQYRGQTISSSLIFSEPVEIQAADSGEVAMILMDFSEYTDFFPSTLGNAVIISHENNLMTVYANIDRETISENLFENRTVETSTVLGEPGNSAWQQGHSSLEFQVLDVKNGTAVNPRVLMPRVGKELPLYYSELYLQNKNGTFFKVSEQNTLPAGTYKAYKKRQAVAMPYKIRFSLNGTLVDQLSFDMLRSNENRLCVLGKKSIPISVMYPTEELMFLGETALTPGKHRLQFVLTDILGKETPGTYSVTIY